MAEGLFMTRTRTYQVLRGICWLCFHTVLPVRYHGLEKLKDKPPFIMISNHVSALDPAVVAYPVKKEQTFFLGKKELGEKKIIRWIMDRMHVILVDRHHTDMEAMRTCMKVLREGHVLVIFPEGTRHHEGQMEQIENGTSLIALRGRVPILPMYIDKPLHFFRRVNAWIGDPILTEDLASEGINTTTCGKMNDRMRETFRRMIAEAEKAIQKN